MEQGRRETEERLLAVQRVMDPQRASAETDILLDSVIVVLRDGPLSTERLAERVLAIWPGTRLDTERIIRAAEAGARAKLLVHYEDLNGQPGYGLLAEAGLAGEVGERARAILMRTRQAVVENVRIEIGRDLHEEEAEHLTAILVDALSAGVRNAFAVYEGRVRSLSPSSLLPERYDPEAISASLDAAGLDAEMREVMGALALSALNPASRFGTEIVTQLAIGYILHAFMARRDQASDVEHVGLLARAVLFLDTPHLFTLSGQTPERQSLLKTLNVALDAGLRVVVPEHYWQEMDVVLDGIERSGGVEVVRRALAEGDNPSHIEQSSDDEPIRAWLSHATPDKPFSWDQYRQHVAQLQTSVVNLKFNVMRLPDSDDARRFARQCQKALRRVLKERPRERQEASGPREDALRRDADTMALAVGARSQQAGEKRFWPLSWVLTPDRRMNAAYGRLAPQDEFPLTISVSQLAALLATFVRPTSARDLAAAAAELLSHETLLQVSGRYPPEVAVGIARSLRGRDHVSDVDLQMAGQLSFEDILGPEDQRHGDPVELVAAYVLKSNADRREKIASLEAERARRDRDIARQEAQAAKHRADAAERSRRADAEKAQDQLEKLTSDLDAVRAERDEIMGQRTADQRIGKLETVGWILVVVGALVGVFTEARWGGGATVVLGGTFLAKAEDWVGEEPIKWGRIAASVLIEVFWLVDVF